MLKLKKLVVGVIANNCYILSDDQKNAFVIDPGGDGEEIIKECRGFNIHYIINTHGHLDHIGANTELKNAFPHAQIVIHKSDEEMLYDPNLNLSTLMGKKVTSSKADIVVDDGDTLDFAGKSIEIMHTPGHTRGGIIIKIEDYVFTGDTIFAGSVGRTDFPGGDMKTLVNSIKNKILSLPDHLTIYPGHGPETTVKEERENNPFLS